METALYRVLQEAIINIVRHAEATEFGVILEANDKEVRMIVEDNGRGFASDQDPSGLSGKRLGLLGIRERLSLVSGRLEVEFVSRPGLHAVRHGVAMSSSSKLRVFLADDHPVVLAGIKALLTADTGIEVVGEACDGRAALAMASELKPDILVLDLSMPGLNGLDVTREMRVASPHCKVVVLTVHEDRSYVRKLLEVGVAGYVLKRSAAADLLRAVHAVAGGGTYLDPAIAGSIVDSVVNPSHIGSTGQWVDLSEREVEVLRLTAIGHSNKAIANTLNLGVKSVETYKARAMEKLGFHSRVELVGYALQRGWLASVPDAGV